MSSRILGSFFSLEQLGGSENCTICRSKLQDSEFIGKVDCGHSFCFECISAWCEKSSTCCACRASVSEIRKIRRLLIAEALEFQEVKKAAHSKLRSSGETEMVLLPLSSSSSSSSSSSFSSSFAAILVEICFIRRQVQRAVSDEDELLALRFQEEEEGNFTEDVGLVDSSPADACSVCKEGGLLVLCDACTSLWHLGCVSPPLSSVPEGLWICVVCEKDFVELKFESKAAFVRERQIKMSSEAVSSALIENQEDEDDGPVVPVRRGRALVPASSSSSSSLPATKKRKSSKKSKGRRMKGYQKDGFVVPVDSDDDC